MRPKGALRRNEINEFITRLYDGNPHTKRVLSPTNGTFGVLSSISLAVHAVGQGLAQAKKDVQATADSIAEIRLAVSVKCWTSSGRRGRCRMLRSR